MSITVVWPGIHHDFAEVAGINPHSFFQSTARFEPRYRGDERRVAQYLESDVRRVLALTVEADGQYGRYQPVVKDVSAHHLRVLPDQTIEFLVNVPIIDEELDGLRYDILFTVRGNLIHYEGELDLRVKDYILRSVDQSSSPSAEAFPPPDRVREVAVGNPLWSIFRTGQVPALTGPNFNTQAEIKGLIEESEGWPSVRLAHYWVRMFYLSAITITTTGYGDILPLTTLARILTGVEALLGILWFGLFLYSLPQRSRR
jgi:Ion channel